MTVSLALTSTRWESALLAGLAEQCESVGPIARLVDVVELLADSAAGLMSAAVVDARFPRLDATVVARLSSAVWTVGVCDDDSGEHRLRQWGLDNVIRIDPDDPSRAIARIARLVATGKPKRSSDGLPPFSLPERTGSLVAVWAPPGAPGRTTAAAAIGQTIAARAIDTMIVDADLAAPGLADIFGMQSDTSGLVAACRLADRGELSPPALARTARALTDHLRILTGLQTSTRKSELRPAALGVLWQASRALSTCTVVDAGSEVDALSGIDCDVLTVVVTLEPTSLSRAISALPELLEASAAAPLHLIINKVRPSLGGQRALDEAAGMFRSRLPGSVIHGVPDDRQQFDAAALRGLTITEYAPASAAASAFAAAADAIARRCAAAAVNRRELAS